MDFEPLLARISSTRYYDENTQRDRRYRVPARATAKLRRHVAAWSNGQLPAELAAFLALTSGFEGPGTCVDIKRSWTGPTGVLAVHDYGNGDCLGLVDEGDRCAVWWIGHDPLGVVFVADSLLDYVTRFAACAEHGKFVDDELALVRPEHECEPVPVVDMRLRRPHDALTGVADEAVVFDLRDAEPGTEVSLARVPAGFDVSRHGRLLIAEPPQSAHSAHDEMVAMQVQHLVQLANGLVGMEQFAEAKYHLTRALQFDPSSQDLRDRIQTLDARISTQ